MSSVPFLIYGFSSVPVEHQSLRKCHVVWRTHEGTEDKKEKRELALK